MPKLIYALPKWSGRERIALVACLVITNVAGVALAQESAPIEVSPPPQSASLQPNPDGTSRQSAALVGGIAAFEPHSLIGKWNGRIRRFGRHPRLFIDTCENGQITGTYKGLIGECPVQGNYNDTTGDITIYVDITGSRLGIIRKLKTARQGIIEAKISGGNLVGSAYIPELGSHRVKWEATKDGE